MHYEQVERDFVKRTVAILEQYDGLVGPRVPESQRYEVTLLLNCLLGLVILPYEHKKREQGGKNSYPEIFKGDTCLIDHLDPRWDVKSIEFGNLKVDGEVITRDELTLRKMIALVRHSIAHTRFADGGRRRKPKGLSVSYGTARHDAMESVILEVHLRNIWRQNTDFQAMFPIRSLRSFSYWTAQSFLANQLIPEKH